MLERVVIADVVVIVAVADVVVTVVVVVFPPLFIGNAASSSLTGTPLPAFITGSFMLVIWPVLLSARLIAEKAIMKIKNKAKLAWPLKRPFFLR